MAKKIKITQVKSTIRRLKNQKATLEALGLRAVGQTAEHQESPSLKGMLNVVSHLVKTEEV